MLRRWRRVVAVGVALVLGAGCRSTSEQGGEHGLPPVPPGATNFSDYEPDNPYEPWGEGVAKRTTFTAPSGEGYIVEVRDYLVSPKYPKALVHIEGGAVLEVRQGSGVATVVKEPEGVEEVGEEPVGEAVELYPGATFTMDAGKTLYITASTEPLSMRSWIVSPGSAP